MEEAYVRLLCPECNKEWEETPTELPDSGNVIHCPNCHASRRVSRFTRTEHDLNTLKQFS